MKLTSAKTCMFIFCIMAGLLLMGICPVGASCSGPDCQVDLGPAIGLECCGHIPVSSECFLSFECVATEHSSHECCRHCPDFHFHFGGDGALVLPRQTKSIAFAAFTCTGDIANNGGLGQDGLPPQSPGLASAAIPLLRTVILLT